jgi:hypothetical protein
MRHRQGLQQLAAIGVRVEPHAPVTGRGKFRILLAKLAAIVEQLFRSVAAHPIFQLLQMLGLLEICDRNLMGAPGPFHWQVVDKFRTGPSLERTKHDHRPARSCHHPLTGARHLLDLPDFRKDLVQRTGQRLMHQRGVGALNEMRLISITPHKVGQFFAADPRQDRRIGDLESVEMQDGQHCPIPRRIDKFVGMPARGQGTSLRLPVADNTSDDQVGIVEHSAIGVEQRISELAAFMDGSGGFWRDMAGNAVGPGELAEKPLQSVLAALHGRIALGI